VLGGSLAGPAAAEAGLAYTYRASDVVVQATGDTDKRKDLGSLGAWSESVSAGGSGTCSSNDGEGSYTTSASSEQTSDTALGPDWGRLTMSGGGSGSASGGCGSFRAGAYGQTSFQVRFTITDAPMTYSATGSLGPGTGNTHLVMASSQGPVVFQRLDQGSYAYAGTLSAGDYSISIRDGGQSEDSSFDSHAVLDLRLGNVPGPPPVAISAGPPATTSETTASFTFEAATTPPPGVYECSLDDAPFATCTSPMPYAGLTDGRHSFRVRFHPDGDPPGDATERTWTVDTAPPVATIDEGPSGSNNPPDAAIRFSSSEPDGATFLCRVDDEAEAPCTSPFVLNGLSPGPHAFAVKATDAAGNTSAPAERGWEVSTTDCASSAIPVGLAKACGATLQETTPGSKIYKTANRAWVGGFEIVPKPEGKLVVNRNTNALSAEGAGVEVVFANRVVPIPVNTIPVRDADAEVGFGGGGDLSLFGLPIEASAKVAWTDGGTGSDLEMVVQIEEVAQLLGEVVSVGSSVPVEDLAGELKAHQANGAGFQLTAAKVEANGEIKIIPRALRLPRALTLKNFALSYELKDGKDFWVGQAGLGLPIGGSVASGGLELTGKLSIYDGSFAGAGLKIDGLNKPIPSTPIFLQSVEGELLFRPEFGFDIGVGGSFGPRIADVELTTFTASVRGWALAEGCESGVDPIQFAFTGEIKPLEQLGVGTATIEGTHCLYASSPVVDVADKIDLTFGQSGDGDPFGFEGSVAGFVSTSGFNLEGTGTVKIPGIDDIQGNELVSSRGIAGCVDIIDWISGGFAYGWGDSVPSAFSGCDLTPWRAAAGPAGTSAAVSAHAVDVADGLPFVGVRATGRTGAPLVLVRGPSGERFASSRDGRTVKRANVLIVHVAREKATYVFVRRPSPGTWRVTSRAAANPIVRVSASRGLPKPVVKARVRPRARGATRTLEYSVKRLRGQRVEFTERAAGVAHRLGIARRARGTIDFQPGPSTDRKREIHALVLQNGLPRASFIVARFKTGRSGALPAPRKLRGRRSGNTVKVSFRKVGGARGYVVELKKRTASLLKLLAPKPRATLREVPAGPLTVTARAIGAAPPLGRRAKLQLR
jgi:hypothetical protein